jgi:translation elongation factor EF-1alpha
MKNFIIAGLRAAVAVFCIAVTTSMWLDGLNSKAAEVGLAVSITWLCVEALIIFLKMDE